VDEFYRIRAAGIFSDADVGKVHQVIVVKHYIFQYSAEAKRLENIWPYSFRLKAVIEHRFNFFTLFCALALSRNSRETVYPV
jgi:hypothetical protein